MKWSVLGRSGLLVGLLSLVSATETWAQEDRCRIALERAAYEELQRDRQFEMPAITSIKQQDFQQASVNSQDRPLIDT
jgi:hypothetical protein